MTHIYRKWRLPLVSMLAGVAILAFVGACGDEEPTATAVPPTATPVPPTATPEPEAPAEEEAMEEEAPAEEAMEEEAMMEDAQGITFEPGEVAREDTLRLFHGGSEGRYIDHELWNPYAIGANHQQGPNLIFEPLAFFSAFADETIPWLATSWSYNEIGRASWRERV